LKNLSYNKSPLSLDFGYGAGIASQLLQLVFAFKQDVISGIKQEAMVFRVWGVA